METKVHVAINDYYYISKQYLQRYTIFKRELLFQFGKETFYDVALEFSKEQVAVLSTVFERIFGEFSEDEYGEVLAQGFERKLNSLIQAK